LILFFDELEVPPKRKIVVVVVAVCLFFLIEVFVTVFTVPFGQFNVSLLNKKY